MNGVVKRTTWALSHRTRRRRRLRAARRGITLLEVVLSIAIFAAAIAIITELVRIGGRGAGEARDFTTAQLLCENKMAEITAGILPADSVNRMELPENREWLYTVVVREIEYGGLDDKKGMKEVDVLIEKNLPQNTVTSRRPPWYRLVRWMIDLDYEAELAAAAAKEQEAFNATGDDTNTDAPPP